jgi:triacylglycerol esterase/lipase EstA (alpha/beta hydrolase family)
MTQAAGKPPVLVCHSMGGLVARAWLRRQQDAGRVARVITIGSPHGGTWIARFSRVPNGRQMRIGGDWLNALGPPRDPASFTCWYSNCDNVVFPASTATIAGADNRFLPGAGHIDLAFRPEVMAHTFDLVASL